MSRWAYYLSFLLCAIIALVCVELAWIGAKYILEGSVVHTYLDHFIAFCGSWYVARDCMRVRLRLSERQPKGGKRN